MKTSLVLILISYASSFLAAIFYVFSKRRPAPLFNINAPVMRMSAANTIASTLRIYSEKWCWALFSSGALYAGLALHTIILFYQGYLSGRLPVAGVFETLFFYSWAVSGVSAIVAWRYNERLTSLIMMPLSIAAFVFSFLNMTTPKKLPLILRTYWFEVHVITSFAAYALFTLALSSAVFFMARAYLKGEGTRDFLDITGRAILFGFFFFSVSMFSGAIWGYVAWGAYWMWEPKILWSFIVWFWYAGAMHLWYMKDRSGLRISVAAVIGFFITLFTYIGVGLLMKSSHSF